MRQRHDTIGPLGRAPARSSRTAGQAPKTPAPKAAASKTPAPKPAAPPPQPDPAPEKGFVRRWVHGALFDNVGLKFLSMVLAVTVFLLVNTDRDREITAHIGVSYTLPDDKVLVSDRLDDVRVTIKGPWRRLRKFNEHEVDRINLDLRRAPSGELAITPDMVHLPPGLTVAELNPRTVRVLFDKRDEKLVEIAPAVSGRAQHGYVVTDVKAVPTTIKVRGAQRIVGALTSIRTREIALDGRIESFVAETELVPPDGVELEGSAPINVHVTVDEELVTRRLPGQIVQVRGDSPDRWTLAPAQIELTLTGTLLAVERARDVVVPVVHLAPNEKVREVTVTAEGLPPGVGVRISPERVKVAPRAN